MTRLFLITINLQLVQNLTVCRAKNKKKAEQNESFQVNKKLAQKILQIKFLFILKIIISKVDIEV